MTQRVLLQIDGMSCGHCVRGVQQALEGVSGVQVERVDVGSAVIGYDPAAVKSDQIKAAISEEGYEVRNIESAP